MEACYAELAVTRAKIGSADYSYHVAEETAAIVGFYALEHVSAANVELEALFVRPDRIGTGVGRQLIHHALLEAGLGGAKAIRIQSDPNAESFYTSAGAVRVGNRESASIPGRTLPVLEIALRGVDG